MKKLLLFVYIFLMSFVASAEIITHLSTSKYTTGDSFLEMSSLSVRTMEFDVTPKPGNMVWTSIKSCIGLWPQRTSRRTSFLRTTLENIDTGEVYFWARNTDNDACTKETFDIPVHTFHRLKLKMVCYAPPMPPGETDFCRGFVMLSSSIQEVMP